MANLKEIKNELKRFGLSENQVLIYLTLIQHGSLRIQEVANLSLIPRTTVSDCLKILLELGLVEKIVEDNFTRIKPYPLSSMKHNLSEKLKQMQTQIDKLDHLEKAISTIGLNSKPIVEIAFSKWSNLSICVCICFNFSLKLCFIELRG